MSSITSEFLPLTRSDKASLFTLLTPSSSVIQLDFPIHHSNSRLQRLPQRLSPSPGVRPSLLVTCQSPRTRLKPLSQQCHLRITSQKRNLLSLLPSSSKPLRTRTSLALMTLKNQPPSPTHPGPLWSWILVSTMSPFAGKSPERMVLSMIISSSV